METRFGNLSLTNEELLEIGKKGTADNEIKERVKQFLKLASSLKLGNDTNAKIIRDQLATARKVLSTHGDALADGYFLKEVGSRLFVFVEEIYSQNPEVLINAVRKKKDSIMTEEFFALFESVVAVHKTLSNVELKEVWKLLIHIVDITGVTKIK